MKLISFVAALGVTMSACSQTTPIWSDDEAKAIREYWQSRVIAKSADAHVVRLTVEGSVWLWDYNKKRGKQKGPPSQVPSAANAQEQIWEKWIDAKVAYDRSMAQVEADKINKVVWNPVVALDPGPPPADLVELFGPPPIFASAVRPEITTVTIEDQILTYTDNVDMRPRYAYYRFNNGVMSAGTRMKTMPKEELNSLLKAAGINESQSKVLKAVSLLEGGFDSVNTYDTGYVSIGFIQFAALKEGGHSLGQTLLQYKKDDIDGFNQDFRKFGLEVTDNGLLVAHDIGKKETRIGPDANSQIIRDKWLTAAFQRAGQRTGYRLAQLKTAMRMYWPLNDQINVILNGKATPVRVGDIFRSEAGAAVLLDRKVNTGSFGQLSEIVQTLIDVKKMKSVGDISAFESLLVECLYYRFNPTKDNELGKPKPCSMIPEVLNKAGRAAKK